MKNLNAAIIEICEQFESKKTEAMKYLCIHYRHDITELRDN